MSDVCLSDLPDGRQAYSTRLGPIADPAATGGEIYVDVDGSLDLTTRTVTWVLEAIDPETGVGGSDDRGLLPPEAGSGAGQGLVTYEVDAMPAAHNGQGNNADRKRVGGGRGVA